MDAGRTRTSFFFPAGLAWTACALALALSACAFVLAILDRSTEVYELYDYLFSLVLVSYALVGGLISSRLPANPVGWFFLGIAVSFTLAVPALAYATHGLLVNPGSLPAAGAMAWLLSWHFVPGLFLLLSFLPLYFPDGRLPSRRWRWVVRSSLFAAAVMAIYSALRPGEIKDLGLFNPLGVEALWPVVPLLDTVTFAAGFAVFLVSAASLVLRFRRSGRRERQQIKWLAYAAAAIPVWFLVNPPIEEISALLFAVVENLLFAGIPVAVGIAVLRYRLYDIDLVINRTLVYGVLTACVVGIYVALVGYLGVLFQTQDNLMVSLLAAGLVAVFFAPLRDRLQRGVDRLMYGRRDDPYAVLSGLGERMEAAPEPNAVLPNTAQTVAQALKLPHVAIRLKHNGEEEEGFVKVAQYGDKPAAEPLVLPLAYRKEEVGELVLSPRAGSEGFTKSEVDLLEALARQIGVAGHAVRLNEDLQRSRERLVVAREEERRRLRRDLHDGVGPRLAALTLKLETARNKLSRDPEAAALIGELSEQARETIADVRRSVHALRPPSLDELGLLGALREGAAQYSQNGLGVSVEAPQELPTLPAAVEVACYHIASEAMTNVVRHAGASKCVIRIRPDEAAGMLGVEIVDDGRGIQEDGKGGVGLHSMRERAEELGGTCTIEAPPSGGTRVVAELPCRLTRQNNADAQQGEGE